MTSEQASKIEELRRAGAGAGTISKDTDIPLNTVKSYLRRHPLFTDEAEKCPVCGKALKHMPHKRRKKFCSDKCRMSWWSKHPEQVQRKANYEYTCPACGKKFTAYGNSHRKYCSHACYIVHRYGGDRA